MIYDIQQISEQDIEGYHRVLDTVGRERKYISFLEAPPIEQTRAFVMHNITRDHPQFVAKVDDQVVGWCDASPKQPEIYAHCAVLGTGILPDYRGRGIGKALIRTTLKKAFEKNIVRIELAVFSDNLNAIRLYEQFGFRTEGELQDDALIDGQFRNSLIMALIQR